VRRAGFRAAAKLGSSPGAVLTANVSGTLAEMLFPLTVIDNVIHLLSPGAERRRSP
jgi:hypothetical protein